MSSVVVIGISSDLPQFNFSAKLDLILAEIGEYKIIAVNDKTKALESFANERNKKITFSSAATRIGFKQAISGANYLIVFWSGNDLSELIFLASAKKIPTKIVAIPLTTVVNKDKHQLFDVYIGRGSPWGNPFPIDHALDVGREDVIERYRTYFYEEIVNDPEKRKQILGLRGMRLGCHCKPLPCHGDVIAEYLNGLDDSF